MKSSQQILGLILLSVSLFSCRREEIKLNQFAGGWTINEFERQYIQNNTLVADSHSTDIGFITLYDNTDANDLNNVVSIYLIPNSKSSIEKGLDWDSKKNRFSNSGAWTADSPDNDRITFKFNNLFGDHLFYNTVNKVNQRHLDFARNYESIVANDTFRVIEIYKCTRSQF